MLTPQADLWITKTDGLSVTPPGEEITYTIVAGNDGPSDALVSSVEDLLPAELINCSWTCWPEFDALCTGGPVLGDLIDSIDLPVGSQASYTVNCTVDPNAIFESFSNTATVLVPDGVTDTNPGNNSATDTNYAMSEIFADGFESGDATQWSASNP